MEYKHLIYSVSERILTITFNRPDKLNAVDDLMGPEIIGALKSADMDDEIRVVIITGAGQAFCAGADLSAGASVFQKDAVRYGEEMESFRDGAGQMSLPIYGMRKPVIAAINGAAVGMGITITLPADIRICSEKAKMAFVFSRRGIMADGCSSWFLPRIVGVSKALEWILSGRIIKPQEALAAGLVSEVLAPEDLMPRARQLALEIAVNTSPISVALNRQLIWKMMGADSPKEANYWDSKLGYWTFKQADMIEGVTSFLEKRPPNFKMKPSTDLPDFVPWFNEK
jgi:enoyl-CoA hydratase/carnithine racemase